MRPLLFFLALPALALCGHSQDGVRPAGGSDLQKENAELRRQIETLRATVATLTAENARLKGRTTTVIARPASTSPTEPVRIALMPEPSSAPASAAKTSGSASSVGTSANDPASLEASAQKLHMIANGDTLAKISAQYYGTVERWGDILAANRDALGESNRLVVGRMLRIP